MAELARQFECNPTTIWKDIKALGIEARPAGARRKYGPPPTDRTCAHCGGPVTFRYPSDAIDTQHQRKGVYCTRECQAEGLRRHPKPEPRRCARPSCGNVFQPRGVDVARGGGVYCSSECQRGERGGEFVACPECGTENWLPYYRIEAGYRFCDYGCWSRYRWREGIELDRLVRTFHANARRRLLGRWGGKRAGRLGGRQRGWSDAHVRTVRILRERDPSIGRIRLSRLAGLTEKQIRAILAELEG
jgi:hypothetical protein